MITAINGIKITPDDQIHAMHGAILDQRINAIASMQYVTPRGHRILLLGGNWLKGTSNRPPTWSLTLAPPYR